MLPYLFWSGRTRTGPFMPMCTCSTSSTWQWIHIGAGIARTVDVLEGPPGGHRYRAGRLAVKERDHIAEAVPVQGVRVEQVGAQGQTQVGDLHAEIFGSRGIKLINPEHRRGVLRMVLLVCALRVIEPGDVAEAENVGGECGRREAVRMGLHPAQRGRKYCWGSRAG